MTIAPSATTASPEPDLSGRQLGDYRLLRRIGRGAMAEVYLSEQMSLGRQVAVKVLRRQLAEDASYIKRFQNEARAAAALVHANIVQIYEVACIDGVYFIALEYVAGQNLRQLLSRQGPVDARLAVNIMRQVAAALHRAARKEIVHRDIKPENIMLSSTGEVKVADFGLSRVAGDGLELTQVGITMGTPLYMSPEQAEGKKLDPRSDLYSFGVTCYHMLAGRPPFEGETALAVAVQHVRTKPQRLESLRPDLPPALCRIVHKLLEKSAQDRYQDATEVLKDLRSLAIASPEADWADSLDDWTSAELIALSDERIDATRELDELMKTAALKLRPKRSRWPVVVIAGTLAAFTLGGVAAWVSRDPPYLSRRAAEPETQVERQETAEAQYWHAMALNRPEAFAAVGEYFPSDPYYAGLAKQQLARFYLESGELDAAMNLCRELAALGDTEVRLRAFGIAGQVLIHDRRDERQQAAARMQELLPLREHLDAQMRREIDRIAPNPPS
jgi:serine/threonine-protein kinase